MGDIPPSSLSLDITSTAGDRGRIDDCINSNEKLEKENNDQENSKISIAAFIKFEVVVIQSGSSPSLNHMPIVLVVDVGKKGAH